jgi:hypothetical protein
MPGSGVEVWFAVVGVPEPIVNTFANPVAFEEPYS